MVRFSIAVCVGVAVAGCEGTIFVEAVAKPPAPLVDLRSPPVVLLLTKKHIAATLQQQFAIEAPLSWQEPSLGLHEANRLAAANVLGDFEGYFGVTEQLVTTHLARFIACPLAAMSDACLTQTVKQTGKKLFRRTLTATEVDLYRGVALSQGAGSLTQGVGYAIVAQLNSPEFLYQRLIGKEGRLSDLELATKLSLLLTSATPDLTLIDAAEAGELATAEGVEGQVDRLLGDPRRGGTLFADALTAMWRVGRPEESLVGGFYPQEVQALAPDLTQEFVRTAKEVHGQGDWRGVLQHDRVVINRRLATHYGLPPPPDDSTWLSTQLPPERRGLLSTGLTLVAHSGSKYTNTIHRGLFILNNLKCRTISPPNNLAAIVSGAALSDTDTVPERVAKLSNTEPCGGCHRQFDPYGLVYENFDGLGRFSAQRDGAPVAARATIDGQTVDGVGQLAAALSQDERVLAECFFRKVRTYATGVVTTNSRAELLSQYAIEGDRRFDFNQLVRAIAVHQSFRQTQETP